MKKFFACLVPVLAIVILTTPLLSGFAADDVLARLGISADSARDSIWQSISNGFFYYPSSPAYKLIPPSERAALVTVIGSFVRDFTESAEFESLYAKYREDQKPEPPEPPSSSNEMKNSMKAELEKSIQETEANIATLPAELQATMQEVVATMRQQLKEIDEPDSPFNDPAMDEAQKEMHEQALVAHQQQLVEWEKEYPVDSRSLIRTRLEEFLRESQGVDFLAEVKQNEYGRTVFVNPAYEQKPANWKLCFRAGKETVEAARTFAQSWLRDL